MPTFSDPDSTIAPSAGAAPVAFGVTTEQGATSSEVALLERTRAYLAAIERDTDPALRSASDGALMYYHPDVQQEELPNRLVPSGAVRDLRELRAAAERGRGVLRAQRYAVRSAMVQGSRVALETLWVGTLAVSVGQLAAGSEMRAHFAMFLDFDGDHIRWQRNYDCFEPF